jgi:hypothetical protein
MMTRMHEPTRTTLAVRSPEKDPNLPPYAPSYDEKELEAFIEVGTRVWADVPDAGAWVREQRGGGDA